MEKDIFGQDLDEAAMPDLESESPESDSPVLESPEIVPPEAEALQTEGTPPTDPVLAQKYWQAAYTKSRQKDREKYGKVETEHKQYQQLLANFYQDEQYAKQVLAQRFPALASQLLHGGHAPVGSPPAPAQTTGLTQQLQQSLGEFGFLAPALGPVLERVIQEHVQARVAPLEQRTTQQTEQARRTEEERLLADMDGQYPGWEDSYGADMKVLDDFLNSNALSHPRFGSKYALYYKLLNPDAARLDATRQMQDAARRRTSLGRPGTTAAPTIQAQVLTADSRAAAFRLAARHAMETLDERP